MSLYSDGHGRTRHKRTCRNTSLETRRLRIYSIYINTLLFFFKFISWRKKKPFPPLLSCCLLLFFPSRLLFCAVFLSDSNPSPFCAGCSIDSLREVIRRNTSSVFLVLSRLHCHGMSADEGNQLGSLFTTWIVRELCRSFGWLSSIQHLPKVRSQFESWWMRVRLERLPTAAFHSPSYRNGNQFFVFLKKEIFGKNNHQIEKRKKES